MRFASSQASRRPICVPWIPARKHLTKAEDGLMTPWEGLCWCNPLYGIHHGMLKWVERLSLTVTA
jgi:hypothetical protein